MGTKALHVQAEPLLRRVVAITQASLGKHHGRTPADATVADNIYKCLFRGALTAAEVRTYPSFPIEHGQNRH